MKKFMSTAKSLLALACCTITVLWVIGLLFPATGIKINVVLGIICAVVAVTVVVKLVKNKELLGKLLPKFNKKPAADTRPAKPAQNEAMKKKNLAWTWDGNDWVVEKDHSKEPVPAGKKYDAETNTFVDASAPSNPKPSGDGRPAKPALPKSMKDNGLVWTWDGSNWVVEEDHSAEPVPVGKVYDKETNTFVELGDVFTEAQMTVIKQIVAAEVKKATKKP